MKAIRTPDSNVTLTISEDQGGSPANDLPAQRIMAYDQSRGQAPVDATHAIQSVWQMTPEERRKIVGGAPVELIVWGHAHPPISMNVGDAVVDLDQAIMDVGHVGRALSKLYATLTDRLMDGGMPAEFEPPPMWPGPEEFIRLWETCAGATNREIPDSPINAIRNGHEPDEPDD